MTAQSSSTSWASILGATGPESVHVVASSPDLISEIANAAEVLRGRLYSISLADLSDETDLVHRFSRQLHFPYKVNGLDALLDMLADLSWLNNAGPYVLLAEEADSMVVANASAFEAFVSILPNLSDRWQSVGVPFHVVFAVSDGLTAHTIERVVNRANARLQESADVPWQRGPVHQVRVRRML